MGNIFHLSHTDLDGYGSQVITKAVFNNKILFFNADYNEISAKINFIVDQAKSEDTILVSDLGLNAEQASLLESAKAEVIVIDHHQTDKRLLDIPFMHINTGYCATRGVFLYFENQIPADKRELLDRFSYFVDIYDLWQSEHKDFTGAKALNGLWSDLKSTCPSGLVDLGLDFILSCLEEGFKAFESSQTIADFENKIPKIKRDFLSEGKELNDIPFNDIVIKYFSKGIFTKNDIWREIEIEGNLVLLTFGLNSLFFQGFSSFQLEKGQYKIAMNVGKGGFLSLRTQQEDINLSQIAKKYFSGGGHPKASGGSLGKDLKLTIIEEVVELVNMKLA
jgi:oligoribonuclease NrnB/cAMP/cGMP phosphodiesterase (DHH superfamily)